jgi:hypothetical protein
MHLLPKLSELVIRSCRRSQDFPNLGPISPEDALPTLRNTDAPIAEQIHDNLSGTDEAMYVHRLVILRIDLESNLTSGQSAHLAMITEVGWVYKAISRRAVSSALFV